MSSHYKIYRSRWHLAVTIFFVAAPLVFLLIFSKVIKINSTLLLADVGISLFRMLIAYLIAAFLGWLAAVAFYRGKRALVAIPIFDVLQSFPVFAALPAAILFLGKSNLTIILFLIVAIVWPVFFSVTSSLKLIRRDWEEAGEIMGLSGWKHFTKFIWPISITGLITGSIIGLGDGWEALIATEIIVGTQNGLGNFFQLFSQHPSVTVFGILGFLMIIFSINKLLWLPLLERSHQQMGE